MTTSFAGWTDRSELIQCCEESPGPVQSKEILARLLHSRIAEPDHEPLNRSELFPKNNGFSNVCGEADGSSVVRVSTLSDQEIQLRSREFAAIKGGRTAVGAWTTGAYQLREIRLPEISDGQLVFVYDDPTDDLLHAVVRGSPALSRPQQDKLREQIRAAYKSNRQIAP